MSTTPTPLPPWHDLLAAITEMLDVPLPHGYDDTPAYQQLLQSRADLLRGYLGGMVADLDEPGTHHADGIRRMKESTPATYTPYTYTEDEPAEADR